MVNYVSIIDLININEIEDDYDNKDIEKHNDVSIDINEVDSILLAFDSLLLLWTLNNLIRT